MSSDQRNLESSHSDEWYKMLTEGEPVPRSLYHFHGMLPANPRCKLCGSPFKGWGGLLMRMMGRERSRYNPRFCAKCNVYDHPGGAEVELTMLFADVRGSTTLAEHMSPREFSRLMNRFYTVAADILIQSDAMVDRLMGDEVIGLYAPGFAGKEHARRAVESARALLQRTGHGDQDGPWLPVGVGVHTGLAYVGIVGGPDVSLKDFTALGDNVNVTARLASQAAAGEILVSEAACAAAGLDLGGIEQRQLQLKGKSEPVGVRVLKA
jgi:adenylate cyclase